MRVLLAYLHSSYFPHHLDGLVFEKSTKPFFFAGLVQVTQNRETCRSYQWLNKLGVSAMKHRSHGTPLSHVVSLHYLAHNRVWDCWYIYRLLFGHEFPCPSRHYCLQSPCFPPICLFAAWGEKEKIWWKKRKNGNGKVVHMSHIVQTSVYWIGSLVRQF